MGNSKEALLETNSLQSNEEFLEALTGEKRIGSNEGNKNHLNFVSVLENVLLFLENQEDFFSVQKVCKATYTAMSPPPSLHEKLSNSRKLSEHTQNFMFVLKNHKRIYYLHDYPRYYVHKLQIHQKKEVQKEEDEEPKRVIEYTKNMINLPNVSYFSMIGNLKCPHINTIESLRVKVKVLEVFNNNAIDDSFINLFQNLERLVLSKCVFVIGFELEKRDSLKTLKVFHSKNLNDVIFLKYLFIERLTMDGCEKLNGSNLGFLTKLKRLKISNNHKIEDSAFLELEKIERLSLHDCPNIEGNEFENLVNLKDLSISGSTELYFQSFSSLTELNKLKLFYLSDPFDVKGYDYLENLSTLQIFNESEFTDDCISFVPKLRDLVVWECKNFKGETLKSLPFLKDLTLGYVSVEDSMFAFEKDLNKEEEEGGEEEEEIFDDEDDFFDDEDFFPNLEILKMKNCENLKGHTLCNLKTLKELELIGKNEITIHTLKEILLSEEYVHTIRITNSETIKRHDIEVVRIESNNILPTEIFFNKEKMFDFYSKKL